MEKIKLPFDMDPPLKTYHNLAHPLGILGGNMPDQAIWFPWLCQKYINCSVSYSPELKFDVYATDRFFEKDKVFHVLDLSVPKNGWKAILEDGLGMSEYAFIDFVKRCLSQEFYVRGIYNEKYISSKGSYQRRDYPHDYLLFGFDDEKQGFYSVGYTKTGRYEEFIIPYEQYYTAIFPGACSDLSMKVIKWNQDRSYETSFPVVLRDLRHYLNSTAYRPPSSPEASYGLSAWRKLIEDIKSSDYIDVRFTKLFAEHRNLMLRRLQYFGKQGVIDGSIGEAYSPSKEAADKAHLLSLKYNMTQNGNYKAASAKCIAEAVEADGKILPAAIAEIQDYMKHSNIREMPEQ